MNALRTGLRRLGAGKAVLYTVHRPLGVLRQSIREGGPLQQMRTRASQQAMIRAASLLPQVQPQKGESRQVHFLTGARYWYQTLFCALSVQAHSPVPIQPILYDDGTLSSEQIERMSSVMPSTVVILRPEVEERLDRELPVSKFPTLRAQRLTYPHLRKLTDIHAGRSGWALVLDSDMLFFREPRFVLDWLNLPTQPCHMLDVEESYGYPFGLMERFAERSVPRMVNVGLCGLKSDKIDWDRLEYWCRSLIRIGGMQYLLEQALTAMLLSEGDCSAAPRADYRVRPDLAEGRSPTAVLHHYVAESKRSYFQHGWRIVFNRASVREDVV